MLIKKINRKSVNTVEETDDFKRIKELTKEDGSINLAEMYSFPSEEASRGEKTIARAMDNRGFNTEKEYVLEHQLRVTHQVLINGGSTADIAKILGVTLFVAKSLKADLNARLIHEVKTLDKNKVVGQALMFYDSVQAKFLQMAKTDPNNPDKNLRSKIEALKGSLSAMTDKQKFLRDIGFYKEPLNSTTVVDDHVDSANTLRDMAQMIISGDDFEIAEYEETPEENVELL